MCGRMSAVPNLEVVVHLVDAGYTPGAFGSRRSRLGARDRSGECDRAAMHLDVNVARIEVPVHGEPFGDVALNVLAGRVTG